MIIVECPNCNAHIEIDKTPVIGLPVKCYQCHVDLEVIWLYPITLDYPEGKLFQSKQPEFSEENL